MKTKTICSKFTNIVPIVAFNGNNAQNKLQILVLLSF